MTKKILLGFLIGVVVLLAAMAAIPVFFKDDIQKAVDEQFDARLNAKIYYDTDAFGLSLFRNFPNLTISIGNFGIAGIDEFESDTLAAIGTFELTVDLMSALSGEQIIVRNIALDAPEINILVSPEGKANYDIMKSTEPAEANPQEEASSDSSGFRLAVNRWEITDGKLSYVDRSAHMFAKLNALNHEGSGDFSLDILDVTTTTEVGSVSFGYDGVTYLSDKTLNADVVMNMNLSEMLFTFKKNKVSLNAFGFGFDGFVSMPEEDITLDIAFAGKDIDLKGLLSLIPGAYQEYLEGITAGGKIGFNGFAKGVYNDLSMPHIAANLTVDNGSIQYAEYPVPLEELIVRAAFDYPSADLKDFSLAVEQFSLSLDGEKSTASLLFKDLEDYFWDLKFDGNLDIGKLTEIIPLEGMDIEGKVNASLQTSGRMSDVEAERYGNLPTSGSMTLTDFKYASPDLPQGFGIAQTDASFNPEAVTLSSFKGNAGKTDLNLTGEIRNYMEYALGKDVALLGRFNFSSSNVDINEWMAAEESEEAGDKKEAGGTEETADTTALEVIRIPANIDFLLTSSIDKVIYDNLSIDNFEGKVIIKDGSLHLENVNFNLLGGLFEMNAGYETVPEEPRYHFDFRVKELSISETYGSFVSIRQLAPFAEKMTGMISTDFKVAGSFLQDMTPNYNTMQGFGLIDVANAALNDVGILSKVSGLTGGRFFKDTDGTVTLKDVLLQTDIKDGRVFVKPFEMRLDQYTIAVEGSSGITGDLDYAFTVLDVPTGAAGQAISGLISSVTGVNDAVALSLDISLGVSGTYSDPKVKFLRAKPSGGAASEAAKIALEQKAKEALEESKSKAKEEAEKRIRQAEALANEKKEELKRKMEAEKANAKEEAEAAAKKVEDELKKVIPEEELDKVKDKLKGVFGRKKKKDGH